MTPIAQQTATAWDDGGTADTSGIIDDSGTVVTMAHAPFGFWRTHRVTVTAASDPLGNPLAGTPYSCSFTTGPYRVHLPVVTKAFVQAPDLVLERIVISSDDVQVIVKS